MELKDKIKYCPLCGYTEAYSNSPICQYCGIEKLDSDITIGEYKSKETEKERIACLTHITNDLAKRNPMYDPRIPYNRLKGKNTSTKMYSHIESKVVCPRCGSTQIQIVQRKWSPLTGFFTNKVDRVCLRCKHRF